MAINIAIGAEFRRHPANGARAGVVASTGSASQGTAGAIDSGDSRSICSSNDCIHSPCFSFSTNSWYRLLLFDGRLSRFMSLLPPWGRPTATSSRRRLPTGDSRPPAAIQAFRKGWRWPDRPTSDRSHGPGRPGDLPDRTISFGGLGFYYPLRARLRQISQGVSGAYDVLRMCGSKRGHDAHRKGAWPQGSGCRASVPAWQHAGRSRRAYLSPPA